MNNPVSVRIPNMLRDAADLRCRDLNFPGFAQYIVSLVRADLSGSVVDNDDLKDLPSRPGWYRDRVDDEISKKYLAIRENNPQCAPTTPLPAFLQDERRAAA